MSMTTINGLAVDIVKKKDAIIKSAIAKVNEYAANHMDLFDGRFEIMEPPNGDELFLFDNVALVLFKPVKTKFTRAGMSGELRYREFEVSNQNNA